MSWLNKKSWLRLLGGLIVLWLILFFAVDPLIKWGLVRGGQAAAGAKVDVDSVRAKWLHGALEVSGVAVADKNQPMKNVAEFSRAVFAVDVGAALRGKYVIRQASIEGLRFGTPRKTSGEVKKEPPSKMARQIREKLLPGTGPGVAKTVETKGAAQVDATKLQGLKKLDDAKAKAAEVQKRWQDKQAELAQLQKDAQAVGEQVKALGGGGNALDKAKKAADAQKKIKELMGKVDAERAQARRDLDDVQAQIKAADDLRHKDVNGLLAAAGLPTLDPQDLARRLLGPAAADRLATALHGMRVARDKAKAHNAASKAAAAPSAPATRRGIDVEFPRAHVYPQFLLEQASLDGKLEKLFLGQDMELKGVLAGVTSNPDVYGKPATLTLSGAASGGETMSLKGELEQQKDPVGVAVDFSGSGFSLADSALGDAQIGGKLTSGQAKVTGRIESVGDEWKGDVLVQATGVKIQPQVSMPGVAGKAAADALSAMNAFQVKIGLSGREDALNLTFSSNAGDLLAAAMKKAAAGQFQAQRQALQAQVDKLYDEKLKGVQAQNDALTKQVLGPLDAQKSGLERQLQDAVKKSVGGVPNLNRLFK